MRRSGLLAIALGVTAAAGADDFWAHWGDGRAELSGYRLVQPREGAKRAGSAVFIFVTEELSDSLRVKADPGKHPKADLYPVLKLNAIRDFQTGIYDYNLMTSAFVALKDVNGRPAGAPTKVSFSSQEWCGNVYSQLLFDAGSMRHTLHSYFDGEADREETVPADAAAVSEDALLLWARGLAAPALAPGESRTVPLVRSLAVARVAHQPVVVGRATLSRSASSRPTIVPAGTFETDVFTAAIEGGRTWTIAVERTAPHRIVSWETSDGERAGLLAAERVAYWNMNGGEFRGAVHRLGLEPRAPRMP